jgi:dihydrofolate reductase
VAARTGRSVLAQIHEVAVSTPVVSDNRAGEPDLGKIVVSENVSLDGVVEDPTGEEGFIHGGWFEQMSPRDREEWAKVEYDEALAADALLLGRRSDQYFGSRWNGREGGWADRLSSLPKYVLSATVTKAVWVNSTVLTGEVLSEVGQLKQRYDGDIVVYGSGQLVHALLAHELVDELRLMVFPCVLGTGERIFAEMSEKRSLRLLTSRAVGDDLTYLAYEVVRA